MHQPYYKDVNNQQYLMPWVRLHATKDYLDMPLIAAEHPGLKVTFNMVPSLLEQVLEYAAGTARDPYLNLALKRAEDLDETERIHVLRMFFCAHYDHMIRPYPRYQQLHDRRGWSDEVDDLRRRVQLFTAADLRDIVTWFYIAWIDPYLRQQDPRLVALERKGKMFTEEDKLQVLEIGREIIARLVPTLKELWDKGQIEISTTPYFHPILPLLVDTEIARRPRPKVNLPLQRFRHPEDAQLQIEQGLEYCKELFGRRPSGMWPSEGSVCPEIVPMFQKSGVRWIASDEDGLALSLGIDHFSRDRSGTPDNADALYRPYIATHEGAETAIFFRDHFLSDQIGFKYAHWNPGDAAGDMIHRLEEIHHKLRGSNEPHVVSVILDGENCWEHYDTDGLPFLRALYGGLADHRNLKTITPSEYLAQFPQQRRLERLHSGSWINHDFGIWIGHPEDNASWDLLAQARQEIGNKLSGDGLTSEDKEKALKSLMIAEGSDWNWWYGDENSSDFDDEFDILYRQHLVNAYTAVGLEPPARLFIPINVPQALGTQINPTAFIEPTIDGRVTNYFEWYSAGHYDPRRGGDSMHQTDELMLEGLYFGFGREKFYLRVDLNKDFRTQGKFAGGELAVYLFTHQNFKVTVPLTAGGPRPARVYWEQPGVGWVEHDAPATCAVGSIIEIAFDIKKFQIVPDMMIRLQAALECGGRELERCPGRAPLPVAVPTKDFEEIMWIV
jgi:alpha-amylase/alpha-mannosidase (GH57 family)